MSTKTQKILKIEFKRVLMQCLTLKYIVTLIRYI